MSNATTNSPVMPTILCHLITDFFRGRDKTIRMIFNHNKYPKKPINRANKILPLSEVDVNISAISKEINKEVNNIRNTTVKTLALSLNILFISL